MSRGRCSHSGLFKSRAGFTLAAVPLCFSGSCPKFPYPALWVNRWILSPLRAAPHLQGRFPSFCNPGHWGSQFYVLLPAAGYKTESKPYTS